VVFNHSRKGVYDKLMNLMVAWGTLKVMILNNWFLWKTF